MEYVSGNIAMILTSILSVSVGYYMGKKRFNISDEYNIIPKKNDGLKSPVKRSQKVKAKSEDEVKAEQEYMKAIESIFGYEADVALEAIKKERR